MNYKNIFTIIVFFVFATLGLFSPVNKTYAGSCGGAGVDISNTTHTCVFNIFSVQYNCSTSTYTTHASCNTNSCTSNLDCSSSGVQENPNEQCLITNGGLSCTVANGGKITRTLGGCSCSTPTTPAPTPVPTTPPPTTCPTGTCCAGTGSTNSSCGGFAYYAIQASSGLCCSYTYRCVGNTCTAACNNTGISQSLCGSTPPPTTCQQCSGGTCQTYTPSGSCLTNCSACPPPGGGGGPCTP